MMWKIRIHRLVLDEDFKKIGKSDQTLILRTIYKKLSIAPEQHGSPLRSPLKGYWKLRASDYRVVYRIEKDTVKVLVLKVGLRCDAEVYKEMFQRLRRLDTA